MKISFLNLNNIKNYNNRINGSFMSKPYSNLAPLQQDSISFKNRPKNIEIKAIQDKLGTKAIKDSNPEIILPFFDIYIKKEKDGSISILEYRQPS